MVHAIEAFGFDRAFLVTALNMAPEQMSLSAKSAKTTNEAVPAVAGDSTSLYDSIIYMKIAGHDAAVEDMKSFVQDNLNALPYSGILFILSTTVW